MLPQPESTSHPRKRAPNCVVAVTLIVLISANALAGTAAKSTSAAKHESGQKLTLAEKRKNQLLARLHAFNYMIGHTIGHSTNKQTLFTPNPGPTPLSHLYTEKFQPADFVSCLESACGPASNNWDGYNLTERPDSTISFHALWSAKIQAPLEQAVNHAKDARVAELSRVQTALDKVTDVRANHPLKPFLNYMRLSVPLWKQIDQIAVFDPDTMKMKLDEQLFASYLVPLTEPEKSVLKLVRTEILEPLFNAVNLSSFDSTETPISSRLQRLYPGLPRRDAQIADAKSLQQTASRLQVILGKTLLTAVLEPGSNAIFERAASGVDLSPIESDTYTTDASKIEQISHIYTQADLFRALLAVDHDFSIDIKALKQSGIAGVRLALAGHENTTETLAKIESNCQSKLSSTLALNASDLRYRQLQTIIDQVRGAAKLVAPHYADPSQRAAVALMIDGIEFKFPESNHIRVQRVLDAIAKVEEKSRDDLALAKSQDPEVDPFMVLETVLMQSAGVTTPEDPVDDSEINKVCAALPADSISDFTLTSLGKISLSWFTANYPESGIAIVAHEMGHMVSATLRGQEFHGVDNPVFNDSLSCVANRNPFVLAPQSLSKLDNTMWSEEDWADHFSNQVMNQLNLQSNPWYTPHNMACSMVMGIKGQYLDSTLKPSPTDVHSSGIFRVLMIGVDRQILPTQCSKFLAYAPVNNRTLTCQ